MIAEQTSAEPALAEGVATAGAIEANPAELPSASGESRALDRAAKVHQVHDLRVFISTDPDRGTTGLTIMATSFTGQPGWTNGRLIPHTPAINPGDNFLRFDFVADPPGITPGGANYVVAQKAVPAMGAVGVEVFSSTNSLKFPQQSFVTIEAANAPSTE